VRRLEPMKGVGDRRVGRVYQLLHRLVTSGYPGKKAP
jgi:hypothetical protein